MGWDYHTYVSQPCWFIDIISVKLKLDAKFQAIEKRKLEAKSRRK